MAGFGGGLQGYGMPGYSALSQMASPQAYGYAPTTGADPTYGLAAMGGGLQSAMSGGLQSAMGGGLQSAMGGDLQSAMTGSLQSAMTGGLQAAMGGGLQPGLMANNAQDPNSGLLQSRQSMLSSYTGAADQPLTSQYNNNPFGSYGNGGLQDTNSIPSSIASLAGYGQNGLSSALSAGLSSAFGNTGLGTGSLSNNGLSNNGLSNSGLSNSYNNGISSYAGNGISSYAGNDASQMASLGGLTPSIGSHLNQASSMVGNSGSNKYSAESLSAGLDTPNGITNIANLLNSAQTSFDSDTQGQVVSNADLNKFAQRFGSQPGATGSQSTLGIPGLSQSSSSAAAEAQSFENQLSHLSNDKLKLGGNLHASK